MTPTSLSQADAILVFFFCSFLLLSLPVMTWGHVKLTDKIETQKHNLLVCALTVHMGVLSGV